MSPEEREALEKFSRRHLEFGSLARFGSLFEDMSSANAFKAADQEEVEAFLSQQAKLSPVQVRVENTGTSTLDHARLTLSFGAFSEIEAGLEVIEDDALLERPISFISLPHSIARSNVGVAKVPLGWEVTVHVGRVVPHQDTWSDPFWIGANSPLNIPVRARLIADGLSPPIEQELTIEIEVTSASLEEEVEAFRAEEKKR